MKKIFRNIAVVALAATMGVTTTGCEKAIETAKQVLGFIGNNILNNIISNPEALNSLVGLVKNIIGSNGQTYTFSVTDNVQHLFKSGENWMYNTTATASSGTVNLTVSKTNTATLVISGTTVDGTTMSDVTIGGLTLTATDNCTVISVPEQFEINGTLTADGKTYNASQIFISEDAAATSDDIYIGTLQIYFGEGPDHVISITNLKCKNPQVSTEE